MSGMMYVVVHMTDDGDVSLYGITPDRTRAYAEANRLIEENGWEVVVECSAMLA